MKHRKIIVAMLGVFSLMCLTRPLWAGEPGKLIMEIIERGLTVLKDPSLKGEEKVEERRQRLWKEISPVFNFEEMSKRALGVHWKARTPEERKEFTELFTNILKEAYIGKTDTYSGEKIICIGEKQNNNYASVQTKLITTKGTEVSVDYNMLSNSEKWTICDIIIEGVSLINNYRSQFNNILIKSSYSALVQKIRDKENKDKVSTK